MMLVGNLIYEGIASNPWAVRLSWLENAYSCPLLWWANFDY